MMIYFYGIKNCSTCQNVLKLLQTKQLDITYIDLKKQSIDSDTLRTFIKKSNLPLSKFFNSSGMLYRQLNMKEKRKTYSEDQLIQLLATHGMLVKRPIVVYQDTIIVGNQKQELTQLLNRF